MKYTNFLKTETSPYLLQHAHNPVNWYPWREAAFEKAHRENKPVFLSIGYSTCHWCHVMAHESFENAEIAAALNKDFVAIKVDREERPDLDNVYMRICQAATGSGGWPMSIFMTPEKRPFFAGTYFPPEDFLQMINIIAGKWQTEKDSLINVSLQLEAATAEIFGEKTVNSEATGEPNEWKEKSLLMEKALKTFRDTFDHQYGGFGSAPKFPTPHNLMFLLGIDPKMAEKTLLQMYKGGIFDHIGGGFCRYSTDKYWLVPHFEKMLYDNALLAIAYTMAYETSGKELYKIIAEKILKYIKTEMLSPEGGFYSAQDADTDGEEGKYYLFTLDEICELLGENRGLEFCEYYGVTVRGNYEGKSIPNQIHVISDAAKLAELLANKVNDSIPKVYAYRRSRAELHTDIKQLTGWNALAIAAFAFAKRAFGRDDYLTDAANALTLIEKHLQKGDTLLAGFTAGEPAGPGFLDDYAFYIFALLQMYKASGEKRYFSEAGKFICKTVSDFWDDDNGGFFFSGKENEKLISSIKESYDGAVPSGNAVMYYNLNQLIKLAEAGDGNEPTYDTKALNAILLKHRSFMNRQAKDHPAGHCFYLLSLFPVKKITCEDGTCRPADDVL